MLTAALVPESEDLQRQLLLWLRSQLLTLPAFANVTVNASSAAVSPVDIAVGQLKQDVAYFAATCTLQVVSLLILAVMAFRVCRWRARLRECRRGGGRRRRAGKTAGGTAAGSELSVYAVGGGYANESSDADRSSVVTSATDDEVRSGSAKSSDTEDGEDVGGSSGRGKSRGRRHLCLVLSTLGLLLLLLTAAAVSVALLIQFWNAGNQLQSRMVSDSSTSSSNSTSSGAATFKASTVDLAGQVNRLIDDSIRSGNDTLIGEFQANFYIIQGFFNRFAQNIIGQLLVLLKLQPVLTELEIFITKIESVVSIDAQAKDLANRLTNAAATVDDVRNNLAGIVCQSAPTTDTACEQVQARLASLRVQVDPKVLQLDGLTTVVTFMRQSGINVTQMRSDFTGTYVSINQSLSTINAEVRKLLDSVTVTIAAQFNTMKNSSDPLGASLTAAVSSDSIWSPVREARTYFVVGVVCISLALVPFYVFAVLLSTALSRCLCWLLSSMAIEGRDHERRQLRLDDLSSLGPDRIGVCPVAVVSAAALRRADARRAKLREYRQRCVCNFRQLSGSSRTYAGWAFGVSLVSAVAFCLSVCAFYATSVAEVRLCHYLRTSEGRAALDANVDSILLQQLWPGVTTLLQTSIQLPIPFDFSRRPDKLLTRLYGQCGNASTSLFTALQLEVINMTQFVYSPTVLSNLDYGKGMLHTALKGLTPDLVLSPDLRGISGNTQVAVLGSLIDSELTRPDLLAQLNLPLLATDPISLADAIDRLPRSSANPTLAAYYSNQLRQLVNASGTLTRLAQSLSSLSSLINASYFGPKAVDTIKRLGVNVAGYTTSFANPAAVTAESDRVYDATVVTYLPPLVGLLEPMRVHILARMLPCAGLLGVLQACSELACSDVVESAMSVAQALLLGLLVLLLAICVYLGLLLQVSGFCCVLRGRCCCCSCGGDDGSGSGSGGSSPVGTT